MLRFLPRACFDPALQRLDLMLYREILRLRASYQLSLDEFRGLYVSDAQVDALIQHWSEEQNNDDNVETLQRLVAEQTADSRVSLSTDRAWRHMVDQFQLKPIEQDILLLALAPELALKYETLYAYLNNDVTRKFPTVELAVRLFDDAGSAACRAALSPANRLIKTRLLEPVNGSSARWSLAAGFHLAPSVLSYLLDGRAVDARLVAGSRYHARDDLGQPLVQAGSLKEVHRGVVSVLEGEIGAGRLHSVRSALAGVQMDLISADVGNLTVGDQSLDGQLQRLILQARLGGAGLYLSGLDKLLSGESADKYQAQTALSILGESQVPIYLSVAPGALWREWLAGIQVEYQTFTDPDQQQRDQLWQTAMLQQGLLAGSDDLKTVADRFVLNAGQISAAVKSLGRDWSKAATTARVITCSELFGAAREQSVGDISKLASKVETSHEWEDLILPPTTMRRVNEAVSAIVSRGKVYQQWQMQKRTGGSNGLMMMFSGASGTGKTMCASLIAKAVGFDLYCIDLSSVVSKYIGETEKNLDRIFNAARRANCILFFDEADALFGKRSEVKDAHDRYANVEVAYLLQKMESHNGVVIMATNIAKNIDQAFSRRLHYAIEFPRPNAEHRQQLWQRIFPSQTPVDSAVDFGFLARQFEGTGGDIKTIALDAAMQAAGSDQRITMECLVQAMARQLIKQGKVPSAADFKHYYDLIERGAGKPQRSSNDQFGRRVVAYPVNRKQK